MDPITIAMGIASVVPDVLHWLGHDNAAESAQKIVNIAQQVTGTTTGDAALDAIKSNPTLALDLQKELDRHSEELDKTRHEETMAEIAAVQAEDAGVSAMAQVEAKSDHWPTYSARPFVYFCFGLIGLISGMTVAICYLGVMFFNVNASVLSQLPAMLGAEAAVMATMAPVLGIASYFRGKMQANPSIPTDNRG